MTTMLAPQPEVSVPTVDHPSELNGVAHADAEPVVPPDVARRREMMDAQFASIAELLAQAHLMMTELVEHNGVSREDLKRNAERSMAISNAAKGTHRLLTEMCTIDESHDRHL